MRNKKVVRLTEGQLHNIIAESVNQILNEINADMLGKTSQMPKKAPHGFRNGDFPIEPDENPDRPKGNYTGDPYWDEAYQKNDSRDYVRNRKWVR